MKFDRKQSISLEVTVTDGCNCHCSYCMEGLDKICVKNPRNEGDEIRVIRNLCENWNPEKLHSLELTFWGGEPFLNFQFLDHLIRETYKYDFVNYHCYTNGTLVENFRRLVNSDYIDSLKGGRLHIQLSYDGEPQHTEKRGDNSSLIFETARLLLENGIEINFKPTLTYDMIPKLPEMWESYRKLYEEFGDFVQYVPTLDTTMSDDSMFDEWKKATFELAKRECRFYMEHGRFLMGWFQRDGRARCRMDNNLHLHTDGMIYCCHGGPYAENNERFVLGTIEDVDDLVKVYENNQLDSSGPIDGCIGCGAAYCVTCHVKCLGRNDGMDRWNTAVGKDLSKCRFMKHFGKVTKALFLALSNRKYFIS